MAERPGRPRRWLREQVPGLVFPLVVAAAVAGGMATIAHRDRIETDSRLAAEAARVASRQEFFARGHLDETLSLCRDGWREELHFHQEPVALAWTPTSVDGYFLEGTDGSSLRQVRCDAQGIARGPRVAHPLHELLPAESPPESGDDDHADWRRALGEMPRTFVEGEVAFEIVRHPITGQVFSRRWRIEDSGAAASVQPVEAPTFALLVSAPAFRPATGQTAPSLEPLARRYWLSQPDAAFDLLARELPSGAGVSEITLEQDRIEVQVAHPTNAFDGKPPAPFGDMGWDEYGVADQSRWYPYEIPGFGCAKGQPLAAVRSAFAVAQARSGSSLLASAWYSCSPAYSNGREGAWHLQPR